MSSVIETSQDDGLDVVDLRGNQAFAGRKLHARDATLQMQGMQRLARAFVEHPGTVLQELVGIAVDLCGADSCGISIEQSGRGEENFYRWVATAGTYASFLDATLPRYPSACGICLERGRPQHFRVGQPFFDILGVQAPTVTDGILLPWKVDEVRGTIWIVAHGREEAFDSEDLRMMELLADFAAMTVRHQRQRETLLEQASAAAAAAMANDLAHQINNPLQSLTNLLFLASEGHMEDARNLAGEMLPHLQRLSLLAEKLLALPGKSVR